jgi:hypothetical protein
MTKKSDKDEVVQRLDVIVQLLQQSLAIELYKGGASMEVIGKHLHIAKASVVKMLKGVNREHAKGA